MDHEKCGGQERLARFVIAAEEVLGQQDQSRADRHAAAERDLLSEPAASEEKDSHRQERKHRNERKTRLGGREQDRCEGSADSVGNRRPSSVLHERAGDKLDGKVEIEADQESADAFGTKLHLEANGVACQKKNRRSDQSQNRMRGQADSRVGNKNTGAPPREQ